MSSHSPTRAKSPSRGHDRESGSRYRHHYRKHRKSSSSPSISPPSVKKNRRRSDAELDHTLRGRPRKRSRSRTRSPLLEGDEALIPENHRKRSQPPSRHRSESAIGSVEGVRRQRSFPNIYREERVRK
ncbi:hypothetical protein CC78DRAFT_254122 [Lojkania enalia]|uniref:Uncharacterized protein n=1 Tax=Lojkania enalia TaxID=147567 RepID=A0A9P4KCQ0_9PLEO|nr:hypothetical protein CC78DRAFT_254122 [Didymosphaeria enalia]